MSNLNQIANVSISLNTATIAKASFGIPLVVSATTAFSDRVRRYSSYSAAQGDNLDPETLAALAAVFSQSPRPAQAYVGRRNAVNINFTTSLQTITTGSIFRLSVNGTEISYTSTAGNDAEDVYAGLSTAVEASSSVADLFTATSDADGLHLSVTDASSTPVALPLTNLVISSSGSASDLAADMSLIQSVDNTWYGWGLTELDDALIQQGAAWTETQSKLFFARSATPAIWTSADDDIASQLQDAQYLRTAVIAHRQAATEYPEFAVMGRFFTKDPGSVVFALKSLVTITPSEFSDTEKGFILSKNANTYEQYAENTYLFGVGTELKAGGRVASGEWIDVVRDRDWLTDYIQKSMASMMVRNDKVPYTNGGIALIVNNLRGSLLAGQQAGVISPDEVNSLGETVPGFKITYPNAADVSADIKASRILYIEFIGLLAGAIQLVNITGTLTYSYEG